MKLDQRGAEGLTVLRHVVQLPEEWRAQASLFVNMEDYCVMGSSRPLVSVYLPQMSKLQVSIIRGRFD